MKYLIAIFLIFSTPALAEQWLPNCFYDFIDDDAAKHRCYAKKGGGLPSCTLIQNVTKRYTCMAEVSGSISYCDKIPEQEGMEECQSKLKNDKYIVTP
jgi:hypothetical protein